MDLRNAAKVVARQWLVLILGLAVVAAVVGGMAWKVPASYSAKATVLLLPPRAGGAYQPPLVAPSAAPQAPPKVYNPYLSFDSSLYILASIVASDLSDDAVRRQLQDQGAGAKYDATPNGSAPSITIVAIDGDPAVALVTANAVVNLVQTELVARQRPTGIPEENWVTATPLALPVRAEPTNTKLKVLAVVAGLGIAMAVSLTFVAESLGLRRRRRSAAKPARVAVARPLAPFPARESGRANGPARQSGLTWLVPGQAPAEAASRRRDTSDLG